MSFSTMRRMCRGLAPLAFATILAASAQAQNRASVPPLDAGPGAELRRNLTTLADNPRSVSALNGAGRAALEMGDAEAALGFFARAAEAEPGDARAKAGMASALVQLARARDALPLFAQAIALGAPEAAIAGDRGLAYDALGDPRRAQADYALALGRGDDPELRRRLALSLAISGQREAALRTIDGQLRAHDRAAWRTQAFVLALTGDAAGADRIAQSAMPGGAGEMAHFFARLAGLSPSQKAMAVHFGQFPSDGRTAASAGVDTSADPGALAFADGGPPPAPARARARPAEPISSASRRRPGSGEERVASAGGRRAATQVAPPVARPDPPPPQPQAVPVETATAGFSLVPQGAPPAPPASALASRLADLAEVVAALPADEQRPPPARQTRTADARPAAAPRAGRSRPAQPANPSRHWVQVAGGANRTALPGTFARLRALSPALLGSRIAYTTPLNATNRLLVGPFDSDREAQAFVNQLSGKSVAAFAWTSPAGQEIERLRVLIPNEPRTSRSRPEPEPRPAARGRRTRP
jgi:tetratricopeptide (TPR) repeat protein